MAMEEPPGRIDLKPTLVRWESGSTLSAFSPPHLDQGPERFGLLLLLPLRGDGFHGRLHLLGIAEIVTAQRLQAVAEFVD